MCCSAESHGARILIAPFLSFKFELLPLQINFVRLNDKSIISHFRISKSDNCSGAVVEHSPQHPEVKGLSLTGDAGNGREKEAHKKF
jgi:hypothetical protein